MFQFEVSYLVDIVQKMLWDTVYHEHLCYHSVRSLKSFFERHGLELFDVERIPTKGGSIRGSVQPAGGPRTATSAIDKLLDLEDVLELHSTSTFQRYASRIDQTKLDVQSLLARLRSRGKKIAGYGASPTVTTLMHHFDVMGHLHYIVDDNPIKQGRFSPGRHIPVYPSEHLYEDKADAVLILAWNYAEPIMKRHRKFSTDGGVFVIPQPYCFCT